MKYLIGIFSVLLFSGCGAIGYMKTNDPAIKTQQAYQLMSQNRFLMAEDYLLSSLDTLKDSPDLEVEADVHAALGNLYKNDGYHKQKKVFESRGTYDTTGMKSITHFKKAIELFDKAGSEVGVAKTYIGLGSAYGIIGDKKRSCGSYQKALDTYDKGKKTGSITNEPVIFNSNYKTIGELSKAFLCSSCMDKPWVTKEECFSRFKDN